MAEGKENVKQAMRELLGMVGIGPEGDKDKDAEKVIPEEPGFSVENAAQEREEGTTVDKSGSVTRPEKGRLFGDDYRTKTGLTVPSEPAYYPMPEVTVVAAGTTIFGDIRSEGGVEIHGKLKGDLDAAGNVRITGKILGDVKGDAVVLTGSAVQGNVTAAASLRLDAGTMVVGDITAVDIMSDGKIKGNVQVERCASFQKNAVLVGSVTGAVISMGEGARIQGTVRITQDGDLNAVFSEEVVI